LIDRQSLIDRGPVGLDSHIIQPGSIESRLIVNPFLAQGLLQADA
jgi:hypothetical protein